MTQIRITELSMTRRRQTDASATPSMTGMRLNTLRVVNLLPNIVEARIIVKIGVAARTTWWN